MKNKIITITFLIYIFLFAILGIVFKDKDISFQERRKLSSFPKLSINNEYVTKLDKYLLDQFPWRDSFRSIKANFNYNFLKKLENNDIYLKDNYIFKSGYPTNKESISNFINKLNNMKSNLTNKKNPDSVNKESGFFLYSSCANAKHIKAPENRCALRCCLNFLRGNTNSKTLRR